MSSLRTAFMSLHRTPNSEQEGAGTAPLRFNPGRFETCPYVFNLKFRIMNHKSIVTPSSFFLSSLPLWEGLREGANMHCSTKNGRFMCGIMQPFSLRFAFQKRQERHSLKLHDACFCCKKLQYTRTLPAEPLYGLHIPVLEYVRLLIC